MRVSRCFEGTQLRCVSSTKYSQVHRASVPMAVLLGSERSMKSHQLTIDNDPQITSNDDHAPHLQCIRYFDLRSLSEIFPLAQSPPVKDPRRCSPLHAAANRLRDPPWTSCGDVKLIYPPFSRPCLRVPGRLPEAPLCVREYYVPPVLNLMILSSCRGTSHRMSGNDSEDIPHA